MKDHASPVLSVRPPVCVTELGRSLQYSSEGYWWKMQYKEHNLDDVAQIVEHQHAHGNNRRA